MRFKLVLPWLCALGLLAGVGALYSLNQKQQAELVQLREACEQLRAELATSTNTQTSAESEFGMIRDLPVLENYDVLSKFDALSELPASPTAATGDAVKETR